MGITIMIVFLVYCNFHPKVNCNSTTYYLLNILCLITQSINIMSINLIAVSVPISLHSHASSIPILNGTNFSDWAEQVQFHLGVLDLDLALRTEKPPAITDSSSAEEEALYMSWERSNRLSIMLCE
jgi:hypothetical protein